MWLISWYLRFASGCFNSATERLPGHLTGLKHTKRNIFYYKSQFKIADVDSKRSFLHLSLLICLSICHIPTFKFRFPPWKIRPTIFKNQKKENWYVCIHAASSYFLHYAGAGHPNIGFLCLFLLNRVCSRLKNALSSDLLHTKPLKTVCDGLRRSDDGANKVPGHQTCPQSPAGVATQAASPRWELHTHMLRSEHKVRPGRGLLMRRRGEVPRRPPSLQPKLFKCEDPD